MKKHISEVGSRYYKKLSMLTVAALLAIAGVAPAMMFGSSSVNALQTQVQTRSIAMSTSLPGATASYVVTFTPQQSNTHPDILLDFCDNSPLPGDSCTATVGTTTPNFSSASASAGWTLTSMNAGRGFYLTTSTLSTVSSTPISFTISNVVNPTNTAAFYARILSYATGTAATQYTAANTPGAYLDYGGVALTTAANISVTSKVFETLSFCVYGISCGTSASLALGNSTTGALSTGTAYVNSGANYSIATNAGHGVSVTMTGQTLCNQGTLNFTNCPTGASANTISAMTTNGVSSVGTSQFGMCAYNGGNSNITIGAEYKDTTNSCNGITTGSYSGTSEFGMDDTSGANGTNGTAGSLVFSSTGVLNTTTGNFTFLGNISATTTAGIYQSNLNLVATSKF